MSDLTNAKRITYMAIKAIWGRPKGKWVDQHENGHGFWVGTCNRCGKENHVDNFCPYCGADMRGRTNEYSGIRKERACNDRA